MWFRKKPNDANAPLGESAVEAARRQHESSDLQLRQALINEANGQITRDADTRPVVTVEQFFTGNSDYGSIGCNLDPPPGPQEFYRTLNTIRARPEVQDVLVEIAETSEDDPDPYTWPFADTLYILTSAPRDTVKAWLALLQPDVVEAGCTNSRVKELLQTGKLIYTVWWD